jgi:hypothetical protein
MKGFYMSTIIHFLLFLSFWLISDFSPTPLIYFYVKGIFVLGKINFYYPYKTIGENL